MIAVENYIRSDYFTNQGQGQGVTKDIKIGGKHLVMKTRLVRYGNAIMRNMYWRSNMEICLRRDLEISCYDANMMQIIGSIFVCQQCRLIMDEKRAIRFESMACT